MAKVLGAMLRNAGGGLLARAGWESVMSRGVQTAPALRLLGHKWQHTRSAVMCSMQHFHKYLHLLISFYVFQATDNDVGSYGKVSYFFSDDPDR